METTMKDLPRQKITVLEKQNLSDEQREALAYAEQLHAEAEALE